MSPLSVERAVEARYPPHRASTRARGSVTMRGWSGNLPAGTGVMTDMGDRERTAVDGDDHQVPLRRRRASRSADTAFDELYRSERDRLVRLAFLLTGSQAAAEDVVQDVFLRARTRLDQVDTPAAYLHRSVTNACWSWHRRRRREDQYRPDRPVVVAGTSDVEMWDALARLAPRRRQVLVLRYYLDYTEAQVAEALGCRLGTVKSATHRALQDLRRVLES